MGLLTNFFSFIPFSYKIDLICTLVDRAFKICNTWSGFHTAIQQLTSILMKNCFPGKIIQRVVDQYLYKVHNTSVDASRQDHSKGKTKRFFKLPYTGPFSLLAQRKIKIIAKKYWKDLDLRLTFSSYIKLSNMFGAKASIPNALRSQVVRIYALLIVFAS